VYFVATWFRSQFCYRNKLHSSALDPDTFHQKQRQKSKKYFTWNEGDIYKFYKHSPPYKD